MMTDRSGSGARLVRRIGWMFLIAALTGGAARAETVVLRVGRQPGLTYLPLIVMQHDGLLDRQARAAGLPALTYQPVQLGSAGALNDALLSGSVDMVAGAITVMAVLTDKTRSTLDVRGIAALNAGPMLLNTINPAIKTVRDFTDRDRIAVSAVKLSIHAILLEMAAAQTFGPDQFERLDHLTVSLPHPEAMASLLAGKTEITAHFTTPPFQEIELQNPAVHTVTSSDAILGGRNTLSLVWTTGRFRAANPVVYKVFLAALEEADRVIAQDPRRAAQIYVAAEGGHLTTDFVQHLIADPQVGWSPVPERVMPYVAFLMRIGSLKNKYDGWKDLFFPEIHDRPGS
jgi:NitT/TauT family transport system substrate-binding protein